SDIPSIARDGSRWLAPAALVSVPEVNGRATPHGRSETLRYAAVCRRCARGGSTAAIATARAHPTWEQVDACTIRSADADRSCRRARGRLWLLASARERQREQAGPRTRRQ